MHAVFLTPVVTASLVIQQIIKSSNWGACSAISKRELGLWMTARSAPRANKYLVLWLHCVKSKAWRDKVLFEKSFLFRATIHLSTAATKKVISELRMPGAGLKGTQTDMGKWTLASWPKGPLPLSIHLRPEPWTHDFLCQACLYWMLDVGCLTPDTVFFVPHVLVLYVGTSHPQDNAAQQGAARTWVIWTESLQILQPFDKLGLTSASMWSSPQAWLPHLQFVQLHSVAIVLFPEFTFGGGSKEAMFVGCSACNYLQNLLTSTPRADLELSSLIRLRLGLGFVLTSWCAFVFGL